MISMIHFNFLESFRAFFSGSSPHPVFVATSSKYMVVYGEKYGLFNLGVIPSLGAILI